MKLRIGHILKMNKKSFTHDHGGWEIEIKSLVKTTKSAIECKCRDKVLYRIRNVWMKYLYKNNKL